MYHFFFIHSSVDGHLGCFHILAVVNSASVNIAAYVSFQTVVFSRYTPRRGTAGSSGNSIFSSLRNLYTSLHNGCTSLHSKQQCRRAPLSPAFTVCRYFGDGHSDQCDVIPHCGFDLRLLIINDTEHLLVCLLAICMSSLEN